MNKDNLAVVHTGNGLIKVINATTGNAKVTFKSQGVLVSSPNMNGDVVSYVAKGSNGRHSNYTYNVKTNCTRVFSIQ